MGAHRGLRGNRHYTGSIEGRRVRISRLSRNAQPEVGTRPRGCRCALWVAMGLLIISCHIATPIDDQDGGNALTDSETTSPPSRPDTSLGSDLASSSGTVSASDTSTVPHQTSDSNTPTAPGSGSLSPPPASEWIWFVPVRQTQSPEASAPWVWFFPPSERI